MSTWGRITKETLTAIANAIRAKTGKSALIEPVDMPAEIAAIPQKELPPAPVMMNAHNFFDYDGTLLMSYSAAEVAEMTELPTPAVSHDGLIFDGWNWTLEEVQAAPFSCVGAHYRTDDGATRLYIKLPAGHYVIKFGLIKYNTSNTPHVTVDWGDGDTNVYTLTTSRQMAQHTYDKSGCYTISVETDTSGAWFSAASIDGDNSAVFGAATKPVIYKIEAGDVEYSGRMLQSLYGLQTATTRHDIETSQIDANGASLAYITIPRTVSNVSVSQSRIRLLALPPNLTAFNTSYSGYSSIYSLALLVIPAGVTEIPSNLFYQSGISSSTIQKNWRIVMLSTTPPTMSKSESLGNTRGQLYVPDDSVTAYQSATNYGVYDPLPISTLITELTGGAS